MKKMFVLILAFALAFSLAACGGNHSGASNTGNLSSGAAGNSATTGSAGAAANTGGKLNPPDWLIGTWENESKSETIAVTAHNVTVSNGNLDFTWQIENVGLKITETNDGGVYRLAYQAGGADIAYAFEKQSDGTVKRTLKMSGMDIPQIFTKK